MAARDAYDRYDQERIVNHAREAHDEPTETLPVDEIAVRRTVPRERVVERVAPVAERDVVVRERPREAVVYDDGYVADDVREDVTIDRVVERRALLDRVSSVIWFFTGLLEATIALRVVFLLLNANRSSGFVSAIYGFTEPFVRPFQGIFNDPTGSNGSRLDSGALVALVIYALVAWAIVRLIWLAFDRAESGRYRSVSHTHSDRI